MTTLGGITASGDVRDALRAEVDALREQCVELHDGCAQSSARAAFLREEARALRALTKRQRAGWGAGSDAKPWDRD